MKYPLFIFACALPLLGQPTLPEFKSQTIPAPPNSLLERSLKSSPFALNAPAPDMSFHGGPAMPKRTVPYMPVKKPSDQIDEKMIVKPRSDVDYKLRIVVPEVESQPHG